MQYDPEDRRDDDARAHNASESAKGAAARVADEVKHETREQAEDLRSQAASVAEDRRHEAGDTVAAMAAALHAGVDSLESDGQRNLAGYCRSAAAGIDQFADRVKHKPAGELLSETQRYAREQPALAFGGAMVAGFMLARFLKSSSPETTAQASDYRAPRPRSGAANAATPTL